MAAWNAKCIVPSVKYKRNGFDTSKLRIFKVREAVIVVFCKFVERKEIGNCVIFRVAARAPPIIYRPAGLVTIMR